MKHSIQNVMNENEKGLVVLPSETNPGGMVIPVCNLRDYLLLLHRTYSYESLSNDSEMIIRDRHGLSTSDKEYVALQFMFKSDQDINCEEFAINLSRVNIRGVSGYRAVMLCEPTEYKAPFVKNVFVCNIVVSKSVFYNDYRVTTGFPSVHDMGQFIDDIKMTIDNMSIDEYELNVVG